MTKLTLALEAAKVAYRIYRKATERKQPEPRAGFRLIGWDGQVAYSHRLPLDLSGAYHVDEYVGDPGFVPGEGEDGYDFEEEQDDGLSHHGLTVVGGAALF